MLNQPRSRRWFLAAAFLCAAARAALPHAAAAPTIYVGAAGGGNVPGFTASGGAASGYTAPSGFINPAGLAVNLVSNTLYVADSNANQLSTYNAATGVQTSLGFNNVNGLNHPHGLLLAGGNLLVANTNGGNILAFNAANGGAGVGFVSPSGLTNPIGLATQGATLFVSDFNGNGSTSGFVGAYTLATGAAVPGFAPITGLDSPAGVAVYGNDLFVANFALSMVSEYDATTGLVINANFVTGVNGPTGLAILGNNLLVGDALNGRVNEYGIPATAAPNNLPTSTNTSFITGLNYPYSITTAVAPEPSTWTLLSIGAVTLSVVALRRRRVGHPA